MKRTHIDEPYFPIDEGGLFSPGDARRIEPAAPRCPGYVARIGDLVATPRHAIGIVTHVKGNLASVAMWNGYWATCAFDQLIPFITNEPRPRTANFAGILQADLESFAPGFVVMPGFGHRRRQPAPDPLRCDAESRMHIETITASDDPELLARAADAILERLDSAGVAMAWREAGGASVEPPIERRVVPITEEDQWP